MLLGGDLNLSFRLIDLCDPSWVGDGAVRPADALAGRDMGRWMRWMLAASEPRHPAVAAVINSGKRWPGLEQTAAPSGFHATNMNRNGFGTGAGTGTGTGSYGAPNRHPTAVSSAAGPAVATSS